MPYLTSEVFDGVRALLNDQQNVMFTNVVQQQYFNLAYEQLRQACQENNCSIGNLTSDGIDIDAGVVDIGGPTGPPLPQNLVEVIACWERLSGTNNDYMFMDPCRFLPKTSVRTSYLQVWSWQDQIIKFLGATGNIEVKLDYIASNLGSNINEFSQIRLTNSVNYLKFATAALCSMFIGENETRAEALQGQAINALDVLLNIKIKPGQKMPVRRMPFRARYKSGGVNYGR